MYKPISDHCMGCPLWGIADCSNCCYIQDIPGVWHRINNVYDDEPIEDLEIYASRAEYFQEELKAINNYENKLKNEFFDRTENNGAIEAITIPEILKIIERAAYDTGKEYTG